MSASSKIIQAAAGNVAGGAVEPVGIDFDGTNDFLTRSSDLTGNTDGKTFTFSCWVYKVEDSVAVISIDGIYFYVNVANTGIQVLGRNSSNTNVINATSSVGVENNTWAHILISVDLTNASNRYVYINDELVSMTWSTYSNDNIDFTRSLHNIFRYGSTEYNGRLAGIYLDYTYRDLSVEANRRDFIDENGLYVTPPTSGIISLPMDDPDDPGRNDGTGGDFTLNGVVAQSGRGPNQYNAAASTFDGSADYLSRSSINGISDGKQLTISFAYNCTATGTFQDFPAFGRNGTNPSFFVDADGLSVRVLIRDASGNAALQWKTSTSFPRHRNALRTYTISFDLTDVSKRYAYVDGVLQDDNLFITYNNLTMDFQFTEFEVGASTFYSEYTDGIIGEFYFDTNYIDLSEDNPFWDSDLDKPKFLGASGELPTGSSPLIYLPLRANDAGNNLGTGGDFTVNSGPYVGARGPSEFWANSAEFVDTSSQDLRNASLGGPASTKTLTVVLSVLANAQVASGGDDYIFTIDNGAGASRFNLFQPNGSSTIRAFYFDGSSLIFDNTGTGLGTSWTNLLLSFDLSDNGKRGYYIDSSASGSWNNNNTFSTYTNSPMDLSGRGFVGSQNATGKYWDGKIGFLYVSDEYIDFSQEANRLKFFDAFGNPVDLGEDGSTPTGSQPLIYLSEGFHLGTNLGSGGDFTPQNTPTDGGYVKG